MLSAPALKSGRLRCATGRGQQRRELRAQLYCPAALQDYTMSGREKGVQRTASSGQSKLDASATRHHLPSARRAADEAAAAEQASQSVLTAYCPIAPCCPGRDGSTGA
ncbi:hypothetical protein CDD83_10503 [Cordyceps sp. RAO-2017]|nr:hypothetical protein CDD83_10503 [Cordyceps sp. RAO-2017]